MSSDEFFDVVNCVCFVGVSLVIGEECSDFVGLCLGYEIFYDVFMDLFSGNIGIEIMVYFVVRVLFIINWCIFLWW